MDHQEEDYRDKIATVDDKGKRIWIFPKKPGGWWYNRRKVLSYLLLAILFSGPYIKVGGNPLFMFNVIERKFIIFGNVFWPQDLHIFAISMIVGVLFIALFTVVFGRLFCGWICPQTIFMEMVFRRIEYWIEGDWTHQKKLKKSPWNREKIIKKGSKHIIFWLISFFIANTFLAYIIGAEELGKIILDGPLAHLGSLVSLIVFTTVFYLVFSQMREQVCTVICPYGRLQGVLLDKNSLTIAYDFERGENRGKIRKGEDRNSLGKGDCIDCYQCVHVCPTGIDIRNGTQLECVNCTACIDACNHMMEAVGLEKGLIRYASMAEIENKKKSFRLTTRSYAYTAVLAVLVSILTFLLFSLSDIKTSILRTRGTTFQVLENRQVSNIYDISIINKTNEDIPVDLKIESGEGEIQMIGEDLNIPGASELKSKFMIVFEKDELHSRKTEILIGVYQNGELIEKIETNFIAPII